MKLNGKVVLITGGNSHAFDQILTLCTQPGDTVLIGSEDGTLTVNITGEYNFVTFDRQVFGIKPEDLEECDLPGKGEPVGTVLTGTKEIDDFIDKIRDTIADHESKN